MGSILSLRFTLPGFDRPVSCTVTVQRLRSGAGLGVEFLDISSEDRQQIREFVESRLSDFS